MTSLNSDWDSDDVQGRPAGTLSLDCKPIECVIVVAMVRITSSYGLGPGARMTARRKTRPGCGDCRQKQHMGLDHAHNNVGNRVWGVQIVQDDCVVLFPSFFTHKHPTERFPEAPRSTEDLVCSTWISKL
jgi:hypothetical protein